LSFSEALPDASDSELAGLHSKVQFQTDETQHKHAVSSKKKVRVELSKYDVTRPVVLVDLQSKTLYKDALVQLRRRHEPDWVARAVRQAFRDPVAHIVQAAVYDALKEPSLRQQLIKRLVIVRYEAKMQAGTTTDVSRQVRHTGEAAATTSNTRAEQKRTVQTVSAIVSNYIDCVEVFAKHCLEIPCSSHTSLLITAGRT
jgi:hypothetical protein